MLCISKLYLFHKVQVLSFFLLKLVTLNICKNLVIYLYYQFKKFVIICHFKITKVYFHFLFLLFLFSKFACNNITFVATLVYNQR
jgi:hypothetical protein